MKIIEILNKLEEKLDNRYKESFSKHITAISVSKSENPDSDIDICLTLDHDPNLCIGLGMTYDSALKLATEFVDLIDEVAHEKILQDNHQDA